MARKGIMPVLKNEAIKKELGQDSIYKDKNWKAVFYNRFAPIPPKADYDAELVSEYVKAGNQIAFDKMDMNSALRQAEEEGQKKLPRLKANKKNVYRRTPRRSDRDLAEVLLGVEH